MIKAHEDHSLSEPILDVRNLTKHYGRTIACDGLTLSICRGTTFGLLGPNGAGKSTLIRLLMGLTPLDSGSITLFGGETQLSSPQMRQRVGYVPELHYIYRWMTIGKVMDFASKLYDHWDADLVQDMLSTFELPMRQLVSTLSKGMTAKLGLVLLLSAVR